MMRTLSVLALAATIVVSAACAANPPDAPTVTTPAPPSGEPFWPVFVQYLRNPTPPPKQPTTWQELMLS